MTHRIMRTALGILIVATLLGAWPGATSAQPLRERIDRIRRERTEARAAVDVGRGLSIRARMRTVVDPVVVEDATARQAFEWWSRTTGVSLVINWEMMESQGVDPGTPIDLSLRNVPAGRLLGLIMRQVAPEQVELIYELTPWYVQVMTKEEANRNPAVRIYDIRDLLHEVPNFEGAPRMDLSSSLGGGGSSGGGGGRGSSGGGSGGLFGNSSFGEDEATSSKQERGEEIAQLIRDTIEPDIWIASGGTHSSIRYYQGRLIVKAPAYVQRQIGIPTAALDRPAPRRAAVTELSVVPADSYHAPPAVRSTGVSGVLSRYGTTERVAGIQ